MFTIFIIWCLVTIVIGCLYLILAEKVVIKGIKLNVSLVMMWLGVLIVVFIVLGSVLLGGVIKELIIIN